MIKGYTAGAFDLFHIGHLNLLRHSKEKCDYLIVGITTDDLIKKTKGHMPVIPFEERAEIVKQCKYVDEVVVQSNLDKYIAWEKYKYDILFSGDDWKNNLRWQGYERRLNNVGVSVEYFPYTKTTSSTLLTNVLNKIKG